MKEVAIQQVGVGLPRVQNFSFLSDARVQSPSWAERRSARSSHIELQLAVRGLLRDLYETFKGTVILPSRPVSLSCTRNFIVYSPGASSMMLFRANPFSWAC
jgi:hypothetical protein